MSLQDIQNELNVYNENLQKFSKEIENVKYDANDCTRSFNDTLRLYNIILNSSQSLTSRIRDKIINNQNAINGYQKRSQDQTDTQMPVTDCLAWEHNWNEHCSFHLGTNWEAATLPDGSIRRTKGGCGGWWNTNKYWDQEFDGPCNGFHRCTDGRWMAVCKNTFKREIDQLYAENNQLQQMLNSIKFPDSPKATCFICNNKIEVNSEAELTNVIQSCQQQANPPPQPVPQPIPQPNPPSVPQPIPPSVPQPQPIPQPLPQPIPQPVPPSAPQPIPQPIPPSVPQPIPPSVPPSVPPSAPPSGPQPQPKPIIPPSVPQPVPQPIPPISSQSNKGFTVLGLNGTFLSVILIFIIICLLISSSVGAFLYTRNKK